MGPMRARVALLAAGVLVAGAWPAQASSLDGVPLLFFVFPGLVLFLPVAIALGASRAKLVLGTSWPKAFSVAAVANVVSTLIVVPLLAALVVLAMTMAWIPVTIKEPSEYGASALVLCIPLFVLSAGVQEWVARRMLPGAAAGGARAWSTQANTLSLVLIVLLLVLTSALRRAPQPWDPIEPGMTMTHQMATWDNDAVVGRVAEYHSDIERYPRSFPGPVTAPVKISGAEQVYPPAARPMESDDVDVVVDAVVDENGGVAFARVLRPRSIGVLGEPARQAVTRWKFKPATWKGQPVKVHYTLSIPFSRPR